MSLTESAAVLFWEAGPPPSLLSDMDRASEQPEQYGRLIPMASLRTRLCEWFAGSHLWVGVDALPPAEKSRQRIASA